MVRLQSASERWPFQAIETVVDASLRTTTDCLGTAPPQSWVDQNRSFPEVTLTTRWSGDTTQLQAGATFVVRVMVRITGRPAYAGLTTDGTTTTSLSSQVPLGAARGVGGALEPAARLVREGVGVVGAVVAVAVARDVTVGVVGVDVGSAATGRAEGPDPPPPPPSSRARPTTIPSTTTRSSSRRVQYTRAGRGPRGRVIGVMSATLAAGGVVARVPHRGAARAPGARVAVTVSEPTDPPQLRALVLDWYDEHARDLPWRDPSASPWAVLVSEVMLQQTPVARVLPVYEEWMRTWPRPADLAAVPTGAAVRAWGRLGYPRRALRLHAASVAIVTHHGGRVPDSYEELLGLPGVGDYTAAAVASFAFRRRHVVLDTNVRRVLARTVAGVEHPSRTVTRAERELAAGLLPEDGPTSAAWAVGTMELGAVVCVAAAPRCGECPVAALCAWRAAGYPAYDGPPRRGQTYDGTDRQCRGRLLAVLRDREGPVHRSLLDAVWPAAAQRERCLDWLVEDGLVARAGEESFTLP